MSRGSLPLIAVLIAGGLAGCGAAANSGGSFHGDQAKVATVVDSLSSASSAHDTTKICNKIFAPALTEKLKTAGGSCTRVVGDRLDTVDTFNVTVQSVTVTGAAAKARVKSTSNGKDKTDTLSFTRLPDGSWRIASLG